MNKRSLATVVAALAFYSPFALASDMAAIPVQVAEQNGQFQLLRGGEPYEIRGAGLEYADLAVFASHGGNSIRTWRTDNPGLTGMELLDRAHALGITVAMCIEIGRERHGFDYDDEKAVAEQLEYARGEVLKYKDHPALLAWIIGNEPNLFFKNPRVFDAVNEISQMIHELDDKHPTTTALAGFSTELAGMTRKRMPDLDFISIQMYGDIIKLPNILKETGFDQPLMVTEWGAIGHWEVRKTSWGAPVEQNSSEKAANYLKSYQVAIAPNPDQVLGSYVFYWDQKQERTPTWYGMFLADGTETETIDVMQFLWTGNWPENRSPQIIETRLDSKTSAEDVIVDANGRYEAKVLSLDPDGDELQYRWEIMAESTATQEGGDREEIPMTLKGLIDNSESGETGLKAPGEPGAYRLFVYVYDGQGHAGHANIPFLVR